MMVRRSLGAGVLVVCLLGAMVMSGDRPRPARAQAADDPAGDEPPAPTFEPEVIGPQGPARFSLAPADPGAVAYEDLSDLEKEATDVAASIMEAEHPPESVAGWSAIARQHAERAAVRRAEYQAGLTGMSDLGVE
jgi:hypothetical protein